jgi:hypothetical protein
MDSDPDLPNSGLSTNGARSVIGLFMRPKPSEGRVSPPAAQSLCVPSTLTIDSQRIATPGSATIGVSPVSSVSSGAA